MLSEKLIDVINSGESVAIAGSGISIEAGLPSWPQLLSKLADYFDSRGLDTSRARSLAAKTKFPEAFDSLSEVSSIEEVHSQVKQLVSQVTTPGQYHKRLADWPFKFYITTNYDCLIEKSSGGRLVAVRNTGRELHKLSAGVHDVVWHGMVLPTRIVSS